MELAKQREITKDPLLDLAYKRVDQAFNPARTPADSTGLPRSDIFAGQCKTFRAPCNRSIKPS